VDVIPSHSAARCLVGKPTLFEKRRQPRIVDADSARAARFLAMRLTPT
jgi:uncharacterized Fe-S cluster protein YjdI